MTGKLFTFISLIFISFISGCQKNEAIDSHPDSKLNFSTDSILFDTVFTNTGTTNRVLKIFNYNSNSINIAELKLAGGDLSNFKININGIPSSSVKDFKIKGNDSAYVFIKAFITPNTADSPFIIEDSLIFAVNGNTHAIPLIAYGQNAIYLNNVDIDTDQEFKKSKPYLIYNSLTVKKGATLRVEGGTRLYFHKNAKLIIDGSLKAEGTFTDSITFASDRMERIYRDEPGQWQGLYFSSQSQNNTLNFCTIKNGLVGLQIDSLSTTSQPKVLLSNSIIKNHEIGAIIGYNASITGLNNLFYNCGQYLLAALNGGDYSFYQNTFAGYNYNFARTTPAIYLADNSTINPETFALSATFTNNIIWGNLTKELDYKQAGQKTFSLSFSNNLIKTSLNIAGSANILNQDPLFINPRQDNYRLSDNSIAADKGLNLSSNSYFSILSRDLEDKPRIFPSELGSYEK